MKRDVLPGCFLFALAVAAACATGDPAETRKLCVPDAFVYCICSSGGDGTKQCNAQGDGFTECRECQQQTGRVCQLGDTQLCDCRDGFSQGTQACNIEGTGFETDCLGCPIVTAGTGGSGGESGTGGIGGESGTGGFAGDDSGGRGGTGGVGGESGAAGTGGAAGAGGGLPVRCGDGKVTQGEQCDDGNTDEGDLCSLQCEVTPPLGSGQTGCENGVLGGGVPVHVFDNDVIVLNGNTANSGLNAQGFGVACSPDQTALSPDMIFAVTVHKPAGGNLRAFVNAQFDSVLYARRTCNGTQLTCDDNVTPTTSGEVVFVTMNDNETVWVVVDGYGAATPDRGPFSLTLSIVD